MTARAEHQPINFPTLPLVGQGLLDRAWAKAERQGAEYESGEREALLTRH